MISAHRAGGGLGTVDDMVVVQIDGKNWEKQYPKGLGEYRE